MVFTHEIVVSEVEGVNAAKHKIFDIKQRLFIYRADWLHVMY